VGDDGEAFGETLAGDRGDAAIGQAGGDGEGLGLPGAEDVDFCRFAGFCDRGFLRWACTPTSGAARTRYEILHEGALRLATGGGSGLRGLGVETQGGIRNEEGVIGLGHGDLGGGGHAGTKAEVVIGNGQLGGVGDDVVRDGGAELHLLHRGLEIPAGPGIDGEGGFLTLLQAADAADTVLVVYRQNRFCPSTSRLPEHYAEEIRRIPGVREVIPVQIVVNNCGASLDVVTFRGVPEALLQKFAPEIAIIAGSEEEWQKRDDGALLGEAFAARRGLKPGDKFNAAGVTVTVSGIIRSPFVQDNNVAYVKLPFLQQASRTGLGVVTQFNVRVATAEDLPRVSQAIDERFRSDQQPTDTRPEKAFFAETASELIELIGFTRWLGIGAVLAVTALVANALLLIVRGRVKENAVLRTLGYPGRAIACLVISEGAMLGLAGGLVGVGLSFAFLRWQSFTLGNEGQTLAIRPDLTVALSGIGVALTLGLLASLWPAWQAVSQSIVKNLRS